MPTTYNGPSKPSRRLPKLQRVVVGGTVHPMDGLLGHPHAHERTPTDLWRRPYGFLDRIDTPPRATRVHTAPRLAASPTGTAGYDAESSRQVAGRTYARTHARREMLVDEIVDEIVEEVVDEVVDEVVEETLVESSAGKRSKEDIRGGDRTLDLERVKLAS